MALNPFNAQGSKTLMQQFVETFNFGNMERSCSDLDATALYRKWKQVKGVLPPDPAFFDPMGQRLLIMGLSPDRPTAKPMLLLNGECSFANSIMNGSEWALSPTKAESALSDEYRSMVSKAYQDCIEGMEPVYDIVGGFVNNTKVLYERVIFPFTLEDGTLILVILSMGKEVVRFETGRLSFDVSPLPGTPQNTHLLARGHQAHSQIPPLPDRFP